MPRMICVGREGTRDLSASAGWDFAKVTHAKIFARQKQRSAQRVQSTRDAAKDLVAARAAQRTAPCFFIG